MKALVQHCATPQGAMSLMKVILDRVEAHPPFKQKVESLVGQAALKPHEREAALSLLASFDCAVPGEPGSRPGGSRSIEFAMSVNEEVPGQPIHPNRCIAGRERFKGVDEGGSVRRAHRGPFFDR